MSLKGYWSILTWIEQSSDSIVCIAIIYQKSNYNSCLSLTDYFNITFLQKRKCRKEASKLKRCYGCGREIILFKFYIIFLLFYMLPLQCCVFLLAPFHRIIIFRCLFLFLFTYGERDIHICGWINFCAVSTSKCLDI